MSTISKPTQKVIDLLAGKRFNTGTEEQARYMVSELESLGFAVESPSIMGNLGRYTRQYKDSLCLCVNRYGQILFTTDTDTRPFLSFMQFLLDAKELGSKAVVNLAGQKPRIPVSKYDDYTIGA